MTKLSVNINKIATLRNARGGDVPNVVQAAVDCQRFGAEGITVHPRPDERHIRYRDVRDLRPAVTTEFNIEGYPSIDFTKHTLIFAGGWAMNSFSKRDIFQQVSTDKYELNVELTYGIAPVVLEWTTTILVDKLTNNSDVQLNIRTKRVTIH